MTEQNFPLVSIIVPVYNVEKYLDKCMVSILCQSYKNIEVIIVNDGSTDKSLNICNKWKEKDSRIEIFSQPNKGLSSARNKGLKYAKGEYVLFVDSDDWISINMVDKMVNTFRINKADMVVCQFVRCFADSRMEVSFYSNNEKMELSKSQMLVELFKDNMITNHVWRKMYKRSLLPEVPFEVGKKFEDILFMPDAVRECKKIVLLNDPLYFYREERPNSIMSEVTLSNLKDHYYALRKAYSKSLEIDPSINSQIQIPLMASEFEVYRKLLNNKDRDKYKYIKKIKKDFRNVSFNKVKISGTKLLYLIIPYSTTATVILLNLLVSEDSLFKRILRKPINFFRRMKKDKPILKKYSNKKKNFLVLGVPDYGNLGDQLLRIAELHFIQKFFSNYNVVTIPFSKLYIAKKFKKLINTKDIVSVQAGGNIGTLYPGIHEAQEKALARFKNSNVFFFPQTIYYSSDSFGTKLLSKSKLVYESMNHFVMFVRDNFSYQFAKNNLPSLKVSLVPDIALFIDIDQFNLNPSSSKKNEGLILIRNDSESTMTSEEFYSLVNNSLKYCDRLQQSDTHIYRDGISDETAWKEIEKLLNRISNSKFVVTDRLHGMIMCYLTNTPCVVVQSKSPKIKGVYKWIEQCEFIKLIDSTESLENAILSVLKTDTSEQSQVKEKLNSQFLNMEKEIKDYL